MRYAAKTLKSPTPEMLSVVDVGTVDNGREARTSTLPKGLTKRNQAVFEVSSGSP